MHGKPEWATFDGEVSSHQYPHQHLHPIHESLNRSTLNSSHSPGTPLRPVEPTRSNRKSVPVASSRTVRVTTI